MLKIENLTRQWNGFQLKNISLNLKQGEYFILLGPCGAGKTLLLETMAGFWRPDKGKILLQDKDITNLPPENRKIGFVYQEGLLFPHLSVKENILFGLRVQKKSFQFQDKIDQFIDLLDMKEIINQKNVLRLSGGEKQKVAMARALVWEPRLLLLDEPCHSLDYILREKVFRILKNLNHQLKIPIIHVTHDPIEANEMAQKIGVMDRGRVIKTGSVKQVLSTSKNGLVSKLLKNGS
jgi:ABC-type sugar transport system ATPase subunit